ncbi:hypothetical protein GCM10011608_10670 [Micromonospora sonchi]|uniref:Uncharacterized protein n=1 Tax=Micromonospora sonchi TaxID=1763543 RepID=A0A917TLK2_9ACTN|nr:hypothetical protein [Micromonospora sonchi]GGM27725.1 hypothetical protein GCM10011608_10670 [Micromonospora sonchi]
MTGDVRSLAAQRDREQRDKDNRNAAEVERIRAGLGKNNSR